MSQLEGYNAAYDWQTSSLMCMKSETIIASISTWNSIKTLNLNMEEVSKLKDFTNESRLAFFSMDFRTLHRRLMHPGLERTIKAAEQAGIQLLNKPTKRFHCKSCKLTKSHEIISQETPTPA